MSATGRGAKRIECDNYPTPSWATRRILEALWDGMTRKASGARVVEPCAGELAIVKAVEAYDPRASVFACDIRGPMMGNRVGYGDATKFLGTYEAFDLLITNPPFNVAHEIIQAQRDTAEVACYLLRRNWLSAGNRAHFYREDMPAEYLMPDRPSFIISTKCRAGCGWSEKIGLHEARAATCQICGGKVRHTTSDMAEYSWFVWTRDRRSYGETRILPSTPLAERRLAKQ